MALFNHATFNSVLTSNPLGIQTADWTWQGPTSIAYGDVTKYTSKGLTLPGSGSWAGHPKDYGRVSLNGLSKSKFSFSLVWKQQTSSMNATWLFSFGANYPNAVKAYINTSGVLWVLFGSFASGITYGSPFLYFTGIGAEVEIQITYEDNVGGKVYLNRNLVGSTAVHELSGTFGASDYFYLGTSSDTGWSEVPRAAIIDNPVVWDDQVITDWSYMDREAPTATPPTITTATPLPDGLEGTAYDEVIEANGDTPQTWNIIAGTLDPSLDFNDAGSTTGTIHITSAAPDPGVSTFTVQSLNGAGSDSKEFTLTIVAAVHITTTSLPDAALNAAYSATIAVTGPGTITVSRVSGALPPGFTLDPTARTITCDNVLTTGLFSFRLEATNGVTSEQKDFTIYIPSIITNVDGTTYQYTKEQYTELLLNQRPHCEAYPFDTGTVQEQVMQSLAIEIERASQSAEALLYENDPRTTNRLITDWERVYGIPNTLPFNYTRWPFRAGQFRSGQPIVYYELLPWYADQVAATLAERRAEVLARATARGGSSRAYFYSIMQDLGYTPEVDVEISEYKAFRSGIFRSGDRIGDAQWDFIWKVTFLGVHYTYFRAGQFRSGERIRSWDQDGRLMYAVSARKPAHTFVLFRAVDAQLIDEFDNDIVSEADDDIVAESW